jgi:hypothetical protein
MVHSSIVESDAAHGYLLAITMCMEAGSVIRKRTITGSGVRY